MLTFFHKTQQKKLVIILGSAFNEYSEGLHFIDELAHNSEVDVISIDKISLPEDSLHTTKKNVNLKRISINIDSKDTVIKLLSSNRIEANNYDKIIICDSIHFRQISEQCIWFCSILQSNKETYPLVFHYISCAYRHATIGNIPLADSDLLPEMSNFNVLGFSKAN